MLVNNHLKSLFGLPTSTKESATSLRNLLDMVTKHLHALEKLKISVESWDPIIIYIMTEKLDAVTHRVWEEQKPREQLPTLQQFKEFLKSRVEMLLALEKTRGNTQVKSSNKDVKPQWHKTLVSTTPVCSFCSNKHYNNNCPEFLKLSSRSRFDKAKKLGLCLNCLKKGKNCEVRGCRKCGAKHHTLLHYERQTSVSPSIEPSTSREQVTSESTDPVAPVPVTSVLVGKGDKKINQTEVILSTALVQVVNWQGYPVTCRALLDNGSQSNLITEEMCKRLGLERQNVEVSISGINQVVSKIKNKCLVNIQSLHNNFERLLSCLVEVSEILKSGCMNLRKWISNDPIVVQRITGADESLPAVHFGDKDQIKTLGLYWSFQKDVLRHVVYPQPVKVDIHGFSDASIEAYGACENLPEVIKTVQLVRSVDTFHFEKFGSLNRLKRGIAYCFRFRRLFKPNEPQFKGYLEPCELEHSMK
ncbi:hypothetical protein NQ317_018783, partial [Molorchus minor]